MNDVLFLGNTEALLAEQVPTLPTLGTDFTVPLVTTHIIDQTGAQWGKTDPKRHLIIAADCDL